MASHALTDALAAAGIEHESLAHARTATAVAEAAALGLPPHEVAKTVVVATPGGNVRAVLPASERLDVHKLCDVLGASRGSIRLLTEDELIEQYPEFEVGAVPPLGGSPDRIVVDARLAGRETIVVEAGTHDESVRLATPALLALQHTEVADLAHD